MKSNYTESPRAYLQRALGDLNNAVGLIGSAVAFTDEQDVKWVVNNAEVSIKKALENISFYRHEVSNEYPTNKCK